MPTPSSQDRFFTVGETVHLRCRVSVPGTKTPLDVNSVKVTTLKRGTTNLTPAPNTFTRDAEGDYSFVIQTTGFTEGTYDLLITVEDGADKVVLVPDRFILKAPA